MSEGWCFRDEAHMLEDISYYYDETTREIAERLISERRGTNKYNLGLIYIDALKERQQIDRDIARKRIDALAV